MGSLPMGSTPCEKCRGRGKTDDETPCSVCEGTGLVAVKPRIERRRLPRYWTSLPVTVRNRLERDLEGQSIAISEGGISVTLTEPVPVGSVVLLQFAVPTHPTAFRLWAVVRHLIGLQHGLEFVSVTEGERLSLRQFCNELALQSASGVQTGTG
jgi:PilZ domain